MSRRRYNHVTPRREIVLRAIELYGDARHENDPTQIDHRWRRVCRELRKLIVESERAGRPAPDDRQAASYGR